MVTREVVVMSMALKLRRLGEAERSRRDRSASLGTVESQSQPNVVPS